ncbi:hypothetical protein Cgig2_028916 [Carnegiea gigantea]|uniref:Alpha 1,4-glycosyltransferase domain-containing protein n=1 Tax=Carnegiea gigantea TaxID=171969 RepID=A0A9Q1KQR1_9CARY|nr:hypothetical protein Cgig2_028916 [Carnegiea gigantea]
MDKPTNNIKSKDDSYFPSQNPFKKSHLSSLFCFPTSVFALALLLLLAYNSFTIFSINVPHFSHESDKETEKKLPTSSQISSNRISSAQDDPPPSISTITHIISLQNFTISSPQKRPRASKLKRVPKSPALEPSSRRFSKRVRQFFIKNSCEVRVFMTWISSLESFGERERFTIESLFKFHSNACLIIVSESMDSPSGAQILRPFTASNFRVMPVKPDYRFVFKNTMAAAWFDQLKKGNINPGEVSLGQNLSNLLRLALLYKYGGIYMDTDFIVLRGLDRLRNSIGAQNVDLKTGNWSRLNNALMVFDKKHPLLNKFIEEFALTFNGNKWGHNGPYLVSRVVERVSVTKGFEGSFSVLPPTAFYPVDWARISSLFQRPKNDVHMRWVKSKLRQIDGETYALHLWNRQSRGVVVEDGSIIGPRGLRSPSNIISISSKDFPLVSGTHLYTKTMDKAEIRANTKKVPATVMA